MNITAAVLHAPATPLALEPITLDDPRDDEVIVRIVGSGICHTDISAIASTMYRTHPMIFGHEGAGVVERVGRAVRSVAVGDHVALSFDYCERCDRCGGGMPAYCREFRRRNFSGARLDGSTAYSHGDQRVYGHFFGQSSFATHAVAREPSCVQVPRDVPLAMLAPLGCGVQTGAGSVLNTFRARPGDTLAVFGTGSVGLSAILGGVVAGCATIIGVDIVESRLALARELGSTHTFDGRDPDVAKHILSVTGGRGVRFAFDTTGVPAVTEQAARSLDELGVLGLVGGQRGGRLNLPMDALC
ncbi:MAG: NAD(P)-dependent alcohol dehydrogenase, partial [Dehalococcoidia bacterium]|nr:NAD(P)-dependent alcohol dehydrogenase [Dehalococcoidia bacterium]